ncbi:uncharacterized protein EI90DRAFT_1882504 [Cantharellus anzutake]|uniref:uncharacterized protein n=1 Tax=Cantharellus anzutake TaxID=1750568 RepID=UPI0019035E37|nr:uncharacterized protein EI90DRAFT_1882504 [Cantharellus anzutake]KAF8326862.1 hypothetical protein EI90DRAFT_1882504 [Cantharellus anzutake]
MARSANIPSSGKGSTGVKKVTTACDTCRLKRQKCDGLHPQCSACAEANLSCTYSRQTKRRGPPLGYLRHVEVRLHINDAFMGLLIQKEPQLAPLLLKHARSMAASSAEISGGGSVPAAASAAGHHGLGSSSGGFPGSAGMTNFGRRSGISTPVTRRGSEGDDEDGGSGSNDGSPSTPASASGLGGIGGGVAGTPVTQRWDDCTAQWREGETSKLLDGISAMFAQPVSRPEHESPLRTTTGSAAAPHSSSGQFHSLPSAPSSSLGSLTSLVSASASPLPHFSTDTSHSHYSHQHQQQQHQPYFLEDSKLSLSMPRREFAHPGQSHSHRHAHQHQQQQHRSSVPSSFFMGGGGGGGSPFGSSATEISISSNPSPTYDDYGGLASTASNSPSLPYNSNPPPLPPPPHHYIRTSLQWIKILSMCSLT